MAILGSPEASRGILGAIKGALGLFGDTNKSDGLVNPETNHPIDEYESSLSEQEILELVADWKKTYSVYYDDVKKTQDLSYNYWVGRHRREEQYTLANLTTPDKNVTDNLIFEAVETFLPIATRANPDPIVNADESEFGQKIGRAVKLALVKWADDEKLRRRLAKATRHWTLYRL